MLVVKKFGGSSVADAAKLMRVAKIITDTYKEGNDVVVVVSAQGDTTDDLIEKAKEVNPRASKREMDMLMASGEQISISLLAMATALVSEPPRPRVVISSKRLSPWKPATMTIRFLSSSARMRSGVTRLMRAAPYLVLVSKPACQPRREMAG